MTESVAHRRELAARRRGVEHRNADARKEGERTKALVRKIAASIPGDHSNRELAAMVRAKLPPTRKLSVHWIRRLLPK